MLDDWKEAEVEESERLIARLRVSKAALRYKIVYIVKTFLPWLISRLRVSKAALR